MLCTKEISQTFKEVMGRLKRSPGNKLARFLDNVPPAHQHLHLHLHLFSAALASQKTLGGHKRR